MSSALDSPKLEAAIAAAFAELGEKIHSLRPDLAPAEQPAAAPPAGDAAVAQAIADARRRAAVLGWFEPQTLVKEVNRRLRERVLSGLVADCDVEPRGRRHVWRLRREPRREALAALMSDSGTLARTLRETAAQVEDSESRLFRQVLRGQSVKPRRAGVEECSAMLQVAEWTSGIFPNAPDPAEVRGLLARNAIKESLGLLIERFHGRQAELRTLRRFVFGSPESDRNLLVQALSGIGGAGKSTLLARFAHGLLERGPKAAVVLLDFDRARLASGDPTALTFELTRQIGSWFPAIAAPLRQLRHDARINLLSSGFADQRHPETLGLEASARSTSELTYLLPGILAQANVGIPGGLPLVIILDTFEVLQVGRGDVAEGFGYRGVEAVAEWAHDLFTSGGLSKLRIVVAGRAPIEEDPSFGPLLTNPEMRLTGLDEASSLALLRDLGLRAAQASAVVGAVGDPDTGSCNPLILRLASRLVKAGTLSPETLAKQEGGRGELDQELVQGILYRRILAHIGDREKDKALAALAHPGLVLRRVTPDLIEHVLFPVLGVKDPGPARARDLFDRLRREVWLVQQTDADTVVHRTDLRRTMLRLIDADMRKEARKIHLAARRYYAAQASGPNEQLSAGEAFYHRLMLMNKAQAGRLDPAEILRFESSLQPTLEDLPPHVLAVVKAILDRPLSDEEGKHLPEPRRTEFILRQGERHLLNDEPERALKLLEAKPELHPFWELRSLAVTAMWPEAKKRGLLDPWEPGRESSETGEVLDRMNLVAWICFCLGDPGRAIEQCSRFLVEYERRGSNIEQLARWLGYLTVSAKDAGTEVPQYRWLFWRDVDRERLGTTSMALEATRHAVLRIRPENGPPVVFSGEALPPSIRLLRQLASAELPAELRRKLLALKKRLEELPKQASSGHILGVIARGFPKAVAIWPPYRKEGKLLSSLVLPNPEFRGPVKFALLEAFKTQKDLTLVADLAYDLVDLRPRDLQPGVFAKAAARPGRAGSEIANLVLYLDRSGALGQFLRAVCGEKPQAPKLARVADAFERWERAFRIE